MSSYVQVNASFRGLSKPRREFSSTVANNSLVNYLKVKQAAKLNSVTVESGGLTIEAGGLTVTGNTELNNNLTVNGNTRLGNASGDLVGFYTTSGSAQQTTAVTAATFVVNAGTAVNTASTFDGYTVGQVVRAVRNVGLLA